MLQWLTQEHGSKPMSMVCLNLCAVAAVAEMVRMAENVFITSFDFIHHSPDGCCFAQFEDTAHDGPEKVWLIRNTPSHGKCNY